MVQAMRSALRASGCARCRLSMIRSFTAITGSPIYTTQLQGHTSQALRVHRNDFSTAPLRRNGQENKGGPDSLEDSTGFGGFALPESVVGEDSTRADSIAHDQESTAIEADVPDSPIPWYLQVDAPARTVKPLLERQQLPDLPDSPPPILQPLLEQISIDLGLDNLTILDLRKLDPPPALGSNLLMVLGTARSEKHLHVSADRLCRWLRSNYKLRPDADGLLGRNELKLKLKRKARRAKLIGNKETEDMDDGVRTGWVCVNVGTVDGAVKEEPQSQNFIGFGRRSEGVKIVVQMLVEEKRQEIDLERLWTGITERQSLTEEVSKPGNETPATHRPAVFEAAQVPKTTGSNNLLSRGYHTSARQSMSSVLSTNPSADLLGQPQHTSLTPLLATSLQAIQNGKYNKARMLLIDSRSLFKQLNGDSWRLYMLANLKSHLESASSAQALQHLGTGYDDRSSTPFLSSFYQALSPTPGFSEWEYHIWMFCFARQLGHQGYNESGLRDLMKRMHVFGISIPTELWLKTIRSILTDLDKRSISDTDDIGQPESKASSTNLKAKNKSLDSAVQLIQLMQSRGEDLMAEEVLVTIQEAIAEYSSADENTARQASHARHSDDTFGMPLIHQSPLQLRLNQLMYYNSFPIKSDEARIRLMQCYTKQQDWVSFWTIWRSIARQGKPKSASLYATMFRLVAESGNQNGCMTVLRHWIGEMRREKPVVELKGLVKEGVEACLRVADVEAESMSSDPTAKGEWLNLWRECNRAQLV